MAPKNRELVASIAKEVVETEGLKLFQNSLAIHFTDTKYYLFRKGVLVSSSSGTEALINNADITERVSQRIAKLKPGILGRIISVGVNIGSKTKRTTMHQATPDCRPQPFVDSHDNGAALLRKYATVVVQAMVWDLLRGNKASRAIDPEEDSRILQCETVNAAYL